ncbi:MAG: DUF4252 domain-containing protein [Ignavibacteriales bacterium]|nr:DUF4252 domain-containing protein [Ignavibacteriales bacterium]
MKRINLIFLTIIFSSLLLFGQEDYKKLDGYVDFGSFEGLYNPEEFTEVNIEAPLLSLASKASKNKDQELANLLGNLKLVKVYTFQIADSKEADVTQKMIRITTKLTSDNWERIVKVKEKGEEVNVYLKNVNENIVGVTVLTMEKGGQATFVNIVGNIDLEAISKLSDKFNIPDLDQFKKKIK